MKSFTIFGSRGTKGTITIENAINRGPIEVKVKELKLGTRMIHNETAIVTYFSDRKGIYLSFNKGNTLLKLTNNDLIDYIQELSGTKDCSNWID